MPDPTLVRTETPFSSVVNRRDIIRAYAHDPWFSATENTASLRHEDFLWWKDDALVIPNDPQIRMAILRSCP